ncbi:hypothetical protein EG329_001696 [Mollisiaceae sp. DMI_Dod_QoI]|nr:hypothetical protein EG329_001696 [Helotiales sp. DMI_Dod_QoI]
MFTMLTLSVLLRKESPYSQAQIDAYLARIEFPLDRYGQVTPGNASAEDVLDYLSALQKHHLTSVPFENLALHYSKEHNNSLNQDDLFEKIVTRRKGGYCFESNGFFGLILQSLGFDSVSVGARVTLVSPVAGWDHQANLVSIGGMTYLVDVAFGGKLLAILMSILTNSKDYRHNPYPPYASGRGAHLEMGGDNR